MRIFLDDYHTPSQRSGQRVLEATTGEYVDFADYDDSWKVVKSYEEFAKLLKKTDIKKIQAVSFDHDLCNDHTRAAIFDIETGEYHPALYGTTKTGLDCMKLFKTLCEEANHNPKVYVHTMNYVAEGEMKKLYERT